MGNQSSSREGKDGNVSSSNSSRQSLVRHIENVDDEYKHRLDEFARRLPSQNKQPDAYNASGPLRYEPSIPATRTSSGPAAQQVSSSGPAARQVSSSNPAARQASGLHSTQKYQPHLGNQDPISRATAHHVPATMSDYQKSKLQRNQVQDVVCQTPITSSPAAHQVPVTMSDYQKSKLYQLRMMQPTPREHVQPSSMQSAPLKHVQPSPIQSTPIQPTPIQQSITRQTAPYQPTPIQQTITRQAAPYQLEDESDNDNDDQTAADEWESTQMKWALEESLREEGAARHNRLTDWQKTEQQEFDQTYSVSLERDIEASPKPAQVDEFQLPHSEGSTTVNSWISSLPTNMDQVYTRHGTGQGTRQGTRQGMRQGTRWCYSSGELRSLCPDPARLPLPPDFGMDPWMAGALPLYSSDSESASESESEEDDAEEAQLQLGATASTDTSIKKKKKKKRVKKSKSAKKDAVITEPEIKPEPERSAPVTPVNPVTSLNFKGAMKIINRAIFLSGGACHLSMLKTRANQTKEFRDYITEKWGTLAEFVQKHPSLLGLTRIENDKEDTVHLKTQIKLCMHYLMPEGCLRRDECHDLHLCRDYLLTSCTNECNLSHDLSDYHNQSILHRNHSDDLDIDKIQFLMKKSRTRATAPFVCTYYNAQNKCPNFNENQKGFCAYLHVCHQYILGDCKLKGKCCKSHQLFNPQAMGVLTRFGYNVKEKNSNDILEELRNIYSQNKDKNTKKAAENAKPGNAPLQAGGQAGGTTATDTNERLILNIDTVVSFLVKQLCIAGGEVKVVDLMATLEHDRAMWGFIQGKYGSIDAFLDDYGDTISLTTSGPSEGHVVVKTKAKICPVYHQKHGCENTQCKDLHICRHFLLGKCLNVSDGGGRGKKKAEPCPQSHLLYGENNKCILQTFHLGLLSLIEARMVFRANRCRATVPLVCRLYNMPKGHNLSGNQKCSKLHVCFYYIKSKCRYPKTCKKLHNFNDPAVQSLLQQYGFDTQQKAEAIRKQIAQAMEQVKSADGDSDNDSDSGESIVSTIMTMSMSSVSTTASKKSGKSRPQPKDTAQPDKEKKTSDVICVKHLNGKCQFGGKCRNLHTKEPFVWQYRDGTAWQAFTDIENCRLENVYSDPKSNSCTLSEGKSAEARNKVDFVTMEYKNQEMDFQRKVRRLGTPSNAKDSSGAKLTEWHWFWQNDQRTWTPFTQGSSSVTSDMLETEHHRNPEGLFTFIVGLHNYAIRFESMTQINLKLGTIRAVRRRPVFQIKATKPSSSEKKTSEEVIPLPSNWLLKKTENYALVEVKSSSAEYRRVDALFDKTMPPGTLLMQVMRVENRTLYENYYRMKEKMRSDLPRSRKEVTEMELFHGTSTDNMTAICQKGFDWRRFGSAVGSKYGQGSYFARDARYSSNFSTCMMLVADVLVGSYTLGKREYRLPPPKDVKNPQGKQFDSCVNSIQNPEVFVVFHWDQCYPKYVLFYS